MTLQKYVLPTLVALVLLLSGIPLAQPQPAPQPPVYIEPTLLTDNPARLSVIIEAASSDAAARAVAQVGGQVTSDLWLIDSVAAFVPAGRITELAALPGVRSVVANKGVRSSDWDGWVTDLPLAENWDGRPDVQPTDNPNVWQIVYPVPIDVGADTLHATALPSGEPIRGQGVTVAVIDSGVYFDNQVRTQLGHVVEEHFLAQADFVDDECRTEIRPNGRERTIGVQRSNYCLLTHRDTEDGYGHGTAVASIIWNNFTDAATGVTMGVAPEANILSVRVLDDNGIGSYERVIEGIQFAVLFRRRYDVKVLNLSISATPTTPYFVDPLNRAVERAWNKGITVITAAGNDGSAPESITVPGNDPYVITVGSLNGNRTPGYWTDDSLPDWSAAGPTADGFVKPDLLAPGVNIITFMHNDPADINNSQAIVRMHPDYSATTSLFRMNGTSMSAAITSGVAALLLQANPDLEPDQVKYRLMTSARPAAVGDETPELVYSVFRQGMGRIWAYDAVLGEFDEQGNGNPGMKLNADLAHGYERIKDLRFHYQGPVKKVLSDDGSAYLYYIETSDDQLLGLGGAWTNGSGWLDKEAATSGRLVWSVGRLVWSVGRLAWVGGQTVASGRLVWSVGRLVWSVNESTWANGRLVWSVEEPVDASGRLVWSVGRTDWEGGLSWAPQEMVDASGRLVWSVNIDTAIQAVSTTRWVDEE